MNLFSFYDWRFKNISYICPQFNSKSMMFKSKLTLALLVSSMALTSCHKNKYTYETVENDPLKAKIYTLPNGLKVYMTVNDAEPRIQTYIAVRVGSKNDPAETTGLAHYLEHIMFKGTTHFGTTNYEAEKVYLDQIEALYETYRKTTDEAQRKALYHQIDSISYLSSKIAIANEYDKAMAAIGSKGTNAYTSFDVTCYVEDIPSNQIDNWAMVQADRFKNMVIRGFHTELEAVYEEKNLSMARDNEKQFDLLMNRVFPTHPYGTQTTIGTQEHLKNPSITNIKNFFNAWYRPNNVAICLSGDFNPDEMVDVITKYFGDWQPAESFPTLASTELSPATSPVIEKVYGPEAENTLIAWPLGGAKTDDALLADIVGDILSNGSAGLIDLDLNQTNKILRGFGGGEFLADYSLFILSGRPMPGQSLEEVRTLLLAELQKVANGDFSDDMLEAIKVNRAVNMEGRLEYNTARANMFVNSFINGVEWKDEVNYLNRLNALTKDQIVAFVNEKLKQNAYVAVDKLRGEDNSIVKMEKPEISPIETNRDSVSAFLADLKQIKVKEIEPAFVDYSKDMTIDNSIADMPIYYKKNTTNRIFSLQYRYDMGSRSDKTLDIVSDYVDLIGTDSLTAAQVAQEFYKIGCQFSVYPGTQVTTINLRGLSDNMEKGVKLLNYFLANAKADAEATKGEVSTILKYREDGKNDQRTISSTLRKYVEYGPESIEKFDFTNAELLALSGDTIVSHLQRLLNTKHSIVYYGPESIEKVKAITSSDVAGKTLLNPLANAEMKSIPTTETNIYVVDYKANNILFNKFSIIAADTYNAERQPSVRLFNEYFGGSMNGIVFQEMRESRGLAYSASARYSSPYVAADPYIFSANISTQADKLSDAINAFDEIIEQIPESDKAFAIAKESLTARLRTQRTKGRAVLDSYFSDKLLGLSHNEAANVYAKVQNMTMDDLLKFHQQNIKGRTYNYCIVADIDQIDMSVLRKLGKVTILKVDDIFVK